MKEQNFISLVVYLYNCEAAVTDFMLAVDNFMDEKFKSYEFVLVNDNSSDGTVNKVKKISDEIKGNITLINLSWKHGQELAILAGNDMAIGDFIYEFNSTVINYPLSTIYRLYEKCISGIDIVAASPAADLRFSSQLFYRFLNRVSYLDLDLTTETFRIVSRRALNRILQMKEKTRYRKALYRYSGFPAANITYEKINGRNKSGSSAKRTFKEKINLAFEILLSFSNIGLSITMILSLLFLGFSVTGGIYALYIYFTLDSVVSGWTTTMLFLSAGFSGIFFVLGLLSKYVSLLLIELKQRPLYTYSSVNKISNER